MKDNLRGFFHYVFFYSFCLTGICLFGEALFLIPFALGIGSWQPAVNFFLVAGALSSPVAMVLCMTRPRFGMFTKESVVIDPKYPPVMVWIGRKTNQFAAMSYAMKSMLHSFYLTHYTRTFRVAYALLNYVVLVCLMEGSRHVFTAEAYKVLAVLAMTGTMLMMVISTIYRFTTPKTT